MASQEPDETFVAPSIDKSRLKDGESYSYFSPVPHDLLAGRACVLGVDEAGRGPVLGTYPCPPAPPTIPLTCTSGPMVYGVFYLPIEQHRPLLTETFKFDDSKVLTPEFRTSLMKSICTSKEMKSCGWATRIMSARDISSAQLRPNGMYNLNAQAMDATIDLIKSVFDKGVNLTEIYVDTIGDPATYQRKLQHIFPVSKITVAKKADSLYPCVSAASICAKVTRDIALDVMYENQTSELDWGSGYPSDARCSSWLRTNKDPVFGWGNECRFSWATAKDMLDARPGVKVSWPAVEDDDDNMKLTGFTTDRQPGTELSRWFGSRAATTWC